MNDQGVFWTFYVCSIYVMCLRRKLHLFWQENLQSSIVWVILSAVSNSMFSSKIAWFMRSFRGTIIISIGYLDPSVLSKALYIFLTLKFAAIQFCQHTFFHRISGHQAPRNKLLFKAAIYFQSNIDYIEMGAGTWSNYFFAKGFCSKEIVV